MAKVERAEKVFKAGIKRDNNLMYYVKAGDVWAVPRKRPGEPKGKPVKAVAAGLVADYSKYLYYVDSDGDVARKVRHVGGTVGSTRRIKKPVVTKVAAKPAAPAAKKPVVKAKRA